jgi:hypothetical protein
LTTVNRSAPIVKKPNDRNDKNEEVNGVQSGPLFSLSAARETRASDLPVSSGIPARADARFGVPVMYELCEQANVNPTLGSHMNPQYFVK